MNQLLMAIDQCLFGYEDGHRLLASSMPLNDELSDLTEFSDLAPGVIFGGSDGYWTGVPAPKIGRYVLMRTWPAPEMSRPGCVWTHALLLEPSILEDLPDLSALVWLFSRPKGPSDRNRYLRPISFEGSSIGSPFHPSVYSARVVRELLLALYGMGKQTVSVSAPQEADAPIFAVWSQQWPRLRRNFRFQTAVIKPARSAPSIKFDAYLELVDVEDLPLSRASDDWVEAAVDDLDNSQRGFLRSFLWQYGNDVRKQRKSFRPLVNVALLDRSAEADVGAKLLKLVTEAFPGRNEAVVLKQAIIDGQVVPRAQLDVLWFVLAHGGEKVFPPPTETGVLRLAELWSDRPHDLLHLAERIADSNESLEQSIFETIAAAVPAEEFWELTKSYPRVRERMVSARPALLSSNIAGLLDNGTLVTMIERVPKESLSGRELIPQVLSRDDSRLVDVLLGRWPQAVAIAVVSALADESADVGGAWLRELVKHPDVLLDPVVMRHIETTSFLYEIADRIGWLNAAVFRAGAGPWTSALANARHNLSGDKREILEAFLLSVALRCGGDDGRSILERYFDNVHNTVLEGRLPWRALNILSPCLPNVGWIRGWDFGLRLRLAVAACYVRFCYPPDSYASLSERSTVRHMLADAATEIGGAENLVLAARRL